MNVVRTWTLCFNVQKALGGALCFLFFCLSMPPHPLFLIIISSVFIFNIVLYIILTKMKNVHDDLLGWPCGPCFRERECVCVCVSFLLSFMKVMPLLVNIMSWVY